MFAQFYRDTINNRRGEAFEMMNRVFANKYINGHYTNECMKLVNAYIENRISKITFQSDMIQLRKDLNRYEEGLNYMYKQCRYSQACFGMSRQTFLDIINHNYRATIEKYIKDLSLTHTFLDKECKKIEKLQLRNKILSQMVMEMYLRPHEFNYLSNNVELYFGMYFEKYLTNIDYTLQMLLRDMETKHKHIIQYRPKRRISI